MTNRGVIWRGLVAVVAFLYLVLTAKLVTWKEEPTRTTEPLILLREPLTVKIWGSTDESTKAWRLRELLREGIEEHPMLRFAEEDADVILWLPSLTRTAPHCASRRLIILDEHDDPKPKVKMNDYLAYFKRSYVLKKDGVVLGQLVNPPERYFPFQYSMAAAYIPSRLEEERHRHLDVVCTLRVGRGEFQARARVLQWTRQAMLVHDLSGYAGELNTGSRVGFNSEYFALMRQARAVVTCQPGEWEGDFRTFEAFASGALVFSDDVNPAPGLPYPFLDGVHYIRIDVSTSTKAPAALEAKLRYYLVDRPDLGARIARTGFHHALRYHRAVSRIDWILRSALAELPDHRSSTTTRDDNNDTAGVLLRSSSSPRPPPIHRKNESSSPRLTPTEIAELRKPLDRRRRHPQQLNERQGR